jgi:hypothetical protein
MRPTAMRRLKISVPAGDAALIRQVAAVLREGGEPAERLRGAVEQAARNRPAASGVQLVAFFRSCPLVGEDLVIERDCSPGRPSAPHW